MVPRSGVFFTTLLQSLNMLFSLIIFVFPIYDNENTEITVRADMSFTMLGFTYHKRKFSRKFEPSQRTTMSTYVYCFQWFTSVYKLWSNFRKFSLLRTAFYIHITKGALSVMLFLKIKTPVRASELYPWNSFSFILYLHTKYSWESAVSSKFR